jgi:hypothetical protein
MIVYFIKVVQQGALQECPRHPKIMTVRSQQLPHPGLLRCRARSTAIVLRPSSRSFWIRLSSLPLSSGKKILCLPIRLSPSPLFSMMSIEASMTRPQGPPLVRRVAPAAVEEPPVGHRRLLPEEVDVTRFQILSAKGLCRSSCP